MENNTWGAIRPVLMAAKSRIEPASPLAVRAFVFLVSGGWRRQDTGCSTGLTHWRWHPCRPAWPGTSRGQPTSRGQVPSRWTAIRWAQLPVFMVSPDRAKPPAPRGVPCRLGETRSGRHPPLWGQTPSLPLSQGFLSHRTATSPSGTGDRSSTNRTHPPPQ